MATPPPRQGLFSGSCLTLDVTFTTVFLLAAVQVALVRLCYGDASLEMVQAMADLAAGYAKEGLWPQVRKLHEYPYPAN